MRPLYLKMRAFGSYGAETFIDFEKPTQNLFLVTGDTGSGKTTIFDAIVFALYGQTSSGKNGRKEGIGMQSQFASVESSPYVEFCFTEHTGEGVSVYRIRRVPKYMRPLKNKAGAGKLKAENGSVALFMPDGQEYAEKNKDEKIAEIVGLTKEQFMQVAMIAQGEFVELLRAKTDTKKEIFRKLFHTEIFERITNILKEQKNEKERELAVMKTTCLAILKSIMILDSYEQVTELKRIQDRLMDGEMSLLEEFLTELDRYLEYEEQQKNRNSCETLKAEQLSNAAQKELSEAGVLEKAYIQLELSKKQLQALEEGQEQAERIQKLCRKLRAAYDVQPFYKSFDEARTAEKQLEERLSKAMEALPGQQELLQQAAAMEVKAEQERTQQNARFHSLNQKVTDALEIFRRREAKEKEMLFVERDCQKKTERAQNAVRQLELVRKKEKENQEKLLLFADVKAQDQELKAKEEKQIQRVRTWNDLIGKKKENDGKEEQLKVLWETVVTAQKEYQQAQKLYDRKNECYISEQAGILARDLRDGEPCIVCGSTSHPSPYVIKLGEETIPTPEELRNLKAEADKKNDEMQKCSNRAVMCKASLETDQENWKEAEKTFLEDMGVGDRSEAFTLLKQTDEELKEKRKQINTDLHESEQAQKLSSVIAEERAEAEKRMTETEELRKQAELLAASLKAALEVQKEQTEYQSAEEAKQLLVKCQEESIRLEAAYQKAHRYLQDTKQKKDQLDERIQTYLKERPERKAETDQKQKLYETAVLNSGLDGDEWRQLTDQYAKDRIEAWTEQIREREQLKQTAAGRIESAKSMIQGKEKPDMEELKKASEELSRSYKQIYEAAAQFTERNRQNRAICDRLAVQLDQRKETIRLHSKIDHLYRQIAGNVNKQNKMDLETYIQRYYLERILTYANRRFEKMSGGQFLLALKEIEEAGKSSNEGLDLMVYSRVTGKRREINTLSGGESFMAALSLALGMADEIQMGNSSIHLDMMFIDEGFGSLDEHARGLAVRILKEMAGGSTMIGIISHVSELKTEIEDKLVVTKDETGSTAEWKS